MTDSLSVMPSVLAQTKQSLVPSGEFAFLPAGEMQESPPVEWIWQGYVARGCATLLTSQWKTGKTTLLTLLLARMDAGGTLAGRDVSPGQVLVISEEGREHWGRRLERIGPAPHVRFLCRPFEGRPTPEAWERLIAALLDEHARCPLALVAVDPLATVLPGAEASAGAILDALMPLTRLTSRGAAVLLMHHPKKGTWQPGQAARGSGALTAYVDVLAEMVVQGDVDESNRRRYLQAWSRLEGTPERLLVELAEDGRDYVSYGDWHAYEFALRWPVLHLLFQHAKARLTREEVSREWPTDLAPRPATRTLHRWLEAAVAKGHLARSGLGHCRDPFRYYLPDRQSKIKPDAGFFHDPIMELYEEQRRRTYM